MNLTNHTVFITGGTAGIGLALATAFAELGNKVIICGRDPDKLQTALDADHRLAGFACDVSATGATQHILNDLATNNWHPSILINNAGVGMSVDLLHDDQNHLADQVSRQIQTNIQAPMLLSIAFLPLLRQHKESAIINVTSGLAITPTKSTPIYCATKAALRSFTKTLRYQVEHDGENIKIIEVLPPLVDTDMTRRSTRSKISPQQVAQEVIDGLKRNRKEIHVGKVRLLKTVYSVSPALAARLMRGW